MLLIAEINYSTLIFSPNILVLAISTTSFPRTYFDIIPRCQTGPRIEGEQIPALILNDRFNSLSEAGASRLALWRAAVNVDKYSEIK